MIPRCKDQRSETLEEFYRGLGQDPEVRPISDRMLSLLSRLEEALAGRPVWGLTSHAHLWLLNQDDSYSTGWVSISPPWPEAYQVTVGYWQASPRRWVERLARSEEEAVRMTLAAMRHSGGWPDL